MHSAANQLSKVEMAIIKYKNHPSIKPITDRMKKLCKPIFKVACRVQIWKKNNIFCQNSYKFGYSFIKNDIIIMYILCIYKKTIILSLFKIDTLNFTMYILTILTSPLKIYVIGLNNLISMNTFFTIKVFL